MSGCKWKSVNCIECLHHTLHKWLYFLACVCVAVWVMLYTHLTHNHIYRRYKNMALETYVWIVTFLKWWSIEWFKAWIVIVISIEELIFKFSSIIKKFQREVPNILQKRKMFLIAQAVKNHWNKTWLLLMKLHNKLLLYSAFFGLL